MSQRAQSGWTIGVLVTIALAAATGIGWASRAEQRANDAYTMAKGDHDTVVKLETLLPRLEKAVDKLEDKSKGAGK